MKVIIAGSRTCTDMRFVELAIKEASFEITEVVCGGAKGVDILGFEWAHKNKVPFKVFTANWSSLGKSAGMVRNREMADYADGLIAVWDGKSSGTKHMIWTAQRRGLKVFVLNLSDAERSPDA